MVGIFSLLAKPAISAESISLKPFNAEFVALRSGSDVGQANLALTNIKANHFELIYRSKVSRFFLSDKRFEKTSFENQNNQLVPITYEYKRTGTGPSKYLQVQFNKSLGQIIIDDEQTLEWDGELDNQLFRIDLPSQLAKGVKKIGYDFINYRGEKRHYELEVIQEENLTLPYGNLMAYKVKINRESNKRVTFAWFAPSLNYNLVRLQQFKDGKEQGDMQLKHFSYISPK
ncbi:DUF3108 domain-containing protein [Glaciecola petra]|uniref:DUF3108 domain-containing protein n=1 Tax=Glaciecola petra TaxID=3075602 RepID=A0ABU2ZS89_9ALTE|nr:DUF3108 domain-containing protein [Aestuariibacter sp. P117]MDT0594307.1 DUF3108 domain-containing protein [Aestuariibacter sp. P117]